MNALTAFEATAHLNSQKENNLKTSESIKNIALALSKAQNSIVSPNRDKKVEYRNYNYADLEAVTNALKIPCFENQLSYTQMTSPVDFGSVTKLCIVTRIMHSSGEWIEGYFPIESAKPNDPQALGSATTYSRRYALTAAFGIYQKDDDGAAAVAVTEKQQKRMFAIATESGWQLDEIKKYLLNTYKIEHSSDITIDVYDSIVEHFQNNKKLKPLTK